MSSAFLHTSVNHLAKSTYISVICSTCFLSCAITLSQSFIKKCNVGSPYFMHLGAKSQGLPRFWRAARA